MRVDRVVAVAVLGAVLAVPARATDGYFANGYGYSYGRQPIRDNELLINILAPHVMEQHVSAGVTRVIKRGQAFNLAIIRALPKSIRGPNNLEAPKQQAIELKMDQWELDVSYSFGF
jgi:long-chain fatty acid transport protein